jgi:catechol 2,3-dioxygenase-like lactoylglutathione lyase family enzyme
MIGYVTIGTNDPEAARTYYDALMGSISAKRLIEFGGFTMYGISMEVPALVVTTPHDGGTATAGNGNMVAIRLDSRAQVAAMHALALDLGGSCEGPPGVRGDEGDDAFYGAYFRDPEGNKIAAFVVGPPD